MKQKLYYVAAGDQVDWYYLVSVVVVADIRGCRLFDFVVTDPRNGKSAESFNKVIDWLLENYPDEYELERHS